MTYASLYLSTAGASWEDTCDHVQFAERSRFRAVWFMDSTARWIAAPPDTARFEPWSLIPAIATHTNRISLGTFATPPGRRCPVNHARAIATTERISEGRVELTITAGDELDRRDASGQRRLTAGSPLSRMVEELAVLESLWKDDLTNFAGEYVDLRGVTCEPKPEFPIPVWIQLGWGRQRLPRIIAECAGGYSIAPHAASDDLVRAQVESIRQACIEIGRNPAELRSSRVVGVTLTADEVDPVEAKRDLLMRADPRTRQLLDEFLRASWPEYAPAEYRFEDYYDLSEFHCVGTPEQVADQILAGTRALGIDEVIIWPHGRLRSWEPDCVKTQGDLIERIGLELVPLLRRAR